MVMLLAGLGFCCIAGRKLVSAGRNDNSENGGY